MDTVNYRPILPDDNDDTNMRPSGIFNTFAQSNKENVKTNKPPPDNKKPLVAPQQVKLTQNKVLIVGLCVIVVILVTVLIFQILKHRRQQSEADEENKLNNSKCNDNMDNKKNKSDIADNDNNMKNQLNELDRKKKEENKVMDNYILRQYMEKRQQTPPVQNVPVAAMEQKNKIESFKMQTIEEDDKGEFVDKEYSKTREKIGDLINEYDIKYDDSMGAGTRNNSPVSVKLNKVNEVINETIDEQNEEEVDSDSDKSEVKISKLCESILVSGKRAGQQCERKCPDGFSMCVNHKGK